MGGVIEVLAVDVETAGSLLTARGLDDEQAVTAVAIRHPASRPVPQGSRRTDTSPFGPHQHRTVAKPRGRRDVGLAGDALGGSAAAGLAAILGDVQSVSEAAGGEEGLLRLARAWHARVMADDVVSHAFSHGFHPQHSERLASYWVEALGGPTAYSDAYGDETSVVRTHSGNGPHEEMDRRAVACFDQALTDVGLSESDPVRAALHDYFAWATTALNRYHESADDVPDGLRIPQWSWDGLQR